MTIRVPWHLVREDIEPSLRQLPGISISGDSSKIVATRTDTTESGLPSPLAELRPPIPSPLNSEPSRIHKPLRRAPKTPAPKPVNETTRQRAAALMEVLELTLTDAPNYSGMVLALDKAQSFRIRETKHTRSDGCVFMTLEKQGDAITLLEGLGFKRPVVTSGSLWGGLSYHRVSPQSETRASATIANTARGCELTIEYGEPLGDSRTIARDFSALGRSGSVD